jgi:hypothetical protein
MFLKDSIHSNFTNSINIRHKSILQFFDQPFFVSFFFSEIHLKSKNQKKMCYTALNRNLHLLLLFSFYKLKLVSKKIPGKYFQCHKNSIFLRNFDEILNLVHLNNVK